MTLKYFFSFLLMLSSACVITQNFSYKNKNATSTETISFSMKGNKIIDAEWEHVSNDPNTSGEVQVGTVYLIPWSVRTPTTGQSFKICLV